MDVDGDTARWTVVVPVRDPRTGKSRLGSGTELNAALAHDTVSAALACPEIRRLVLVTDDPWWVGADLLAQSRLRLVVHRAPGLNPAVVAGLRHGGAHTAVLLGDLPCLRQEDLALALAAARNVPRGMVRDRHGTGTTLLTGGAHRPQFGPESAARHRDAGYRELLLPLGSTLRHDVDTAEDLRDAAARLGPRTRQALTRDRGAGMPTPGPTPRPAVHGHFVPTLEVFA